MKNVPASALEVELGALSANCQQGAAPRIDLEEMGHHQPPTPVVTDNATIDGFVNDNIIKRKSRAIDMRLYWVCGRVRQGHYLVYWKIGKDNLDDYFTKNHPTKHHRAIRGTYMVPTADSSKHACYQVPRDMRGYVKSPPQPGKRTTDRQGLLLLLTE